MTSRIAIGHSIVFRCKTCGILHHKIVRGAELNMGTTPIDVVEHFAQRGDGHLVSTIIEPVFQDDSLTPVYPHTTDHYSVDFEGDSWIATIREMPMMWFKGATPVEALDTLIKIVRDARDYQLAHPEDRGRFRS